jgi:CubicO group peptidase (beta-lactamase class C family)
MDGRAMKKRLRIRPTRQIRSFSWVGLTAALVLSVAFALVVLGVAQASANATDEPETSAPDFAAIDEYVRKEMEATRLPGLALGIVRGDEIVHLKGFGEADSSGRSVSPQTPFVIGSTTKSFTALATMQLVEAGKVDLDAPVQRYLPWFRVADEKASSRITVRDLLNQTSGLPTRETTAQFTKTDNSDSALEKQVRDLKDTQLTAPVGTRFAYSNFNFDVLGLIVQTGSGQSYEQYVHRHIFTPREMNYSYTSPEQARDHGRTMGYRYWFGRPFAYEMPYNRGHLPAGFINSSAEDVTHYLIAHLNEGRYEGTRVLSPSGIAEMHKPAVQTGIPDASRTAYGMGWFVGDANGVPTVQHGGDPASFHADLVLVPESKWGVVVLTNGQNGMNNARIDGIAAGVTSLLLGKEPPVVASNSARPTVLMWVMIVLAVQILGIVWSAILLRRWHRNPSRRPRGWFRMAIRIVPSFLANLLWVLLAIFVVPFPAGAPLLALPMFVPDLGYPLLLSVGIALGWGLLRPVLVFGALRRQEVKDAGATRESTVTATT